jgi:hypothetical protein
MTTSPKFDFKSDSLQLTDAELAKAESGEFGSKFMDRGVHSVKIIEAGWHEGKDSKSTACASDPTWHNLKVVYENGSGETYNHYLQIPTSKLTFTITTKKGKVMESAFMFVKFRAFCAGLGELATPDAKVMSSLIKKFFVKPEKLVGKEMEITLGYRGCYLLYLEGSGEDATYSIMNKDGTILDPGPYKKKEAATQAAIKHQKAVTQLELLGITSLLIDEEDESSVENMGKADEDVFDKLPKEDAASDW